MKEVHHETPLSSFSSSIYSKGSEGGILNQAAHNCFSGHCLRSFQLNCWSVCLLGCYVFAPTFAFKMNWDFQNKQARGGEGKRPQPARTHASRGDYTLMLPEPETVQPHCLTQTCTQLQNAFEICE